MREAAPGSGGCIQQVLGQLPADKRSGAVGRLKIPLTDQLLVRLGDRAARKIERRGQLTRGWNTLAAGKAAVENPETPEFVDLPGQRHGRGGVDDDSSGHKWSSRIIKKWPMCTATSLPIMAAMNTYTPTQRTKVRRLSKRAVYDKAQVHAILDEGFLCHVGFTQENQPFVIPTLYARSGETLYMHGSGASRMLKTLAQGVDVCLTVTLVDGFVLGALGLPSLHELSLGDGTGARASGCGARGENGGVAHHHRPRRAGTLG